MANTQSMIKKCVVSKVSDDTGQFQPVQATQNGKTIEFMHLTPYGVYSVMPSDKDQTLCVTFNCFDAEENRVGFGNVQNTRFKEMKEGEVTFGNPITLSKIYFKENGDIDIECSADNNVNIVGNCNVTIGGNATIAVTGNTSITTSGNTTLNTTGNTTVDSSGNMSATVGGTMTANVTGNTTFTTPIFKINGALQVTGEVTSFFGLGTQLSMSDIRTTYNIHTHPETGTVTTAPNQLL